MASGNGEHSGHRDRMRKKFIQFGFDGLEQHEALELLLFYAVPRKDTNPLAHKLIEEFGSFSAVLDAPIDLLEESGLSHNAAVYLKLFPEACRLYTEDKHNSEGRIVSSENVGAMLMNMFIGRNYETVILILTDAKFKRIFCGVISKGSVNACEIFMRKIVELAVMYNASYAIISHNHPSGLALPSGCDLSSTEKIHHSLQLVNTTLLDHIIVADNDYISLAQSGMCREIFGDDYEF